ncbi:MAG: beta-ketoacyl reductase, partial [Chloroflexota bacterium]
DSAVPVILRELGLADGEEQVAWRRGARHGARLAAVSRLAPASGRPFRGFRTDATYLIVGGLGGVGLTLLRWMIERGARHVVLTGRRPPAAEQEALLRELRRNGAEIVVEPADVSVFEAMAAVLSKVSGSMPPLRGVFHAAVVLEDGMLDHLTAESIRRVLAPKTEGAWNLHRLTADLELDLFVLFSSAASLIGTPGQASYAAANAFLDGLAHHRRAQGLPGLSLNWGPWAEVGQAARDAKRGQRLADVGLASFTPAEGLGLLARMLGASAAQVGAMRFDYDRWRETYPKAAQSPYFAEVGRAFSASSETPEPSEKAGGVQPGAEPTVRERILAAEEDWQRLRLIEEHLCRQLSRVLRVTAATVELHTPFRQLGVDSLLALEFRNRIEAMLGLNLPSTLVWAYPTVAKLAGHLAERLGVAPAASAVPTEGESLSLDALFQEIDALGDDGVRRMLSNAP